MSEWFITTERNKFGGFDTWYELYSGKKMIAALKPKRKFIINEKWRNGFGDLTYPGIDLS